MFWFVHACIYISVCVCVSVCVVHYWTSIPLSWKSDRWSGFPCYSYSFESVWVLAKALFPPKLAWGDWPYACEFCVCVCVHPCMPAENQCSASLVVGPGDSQVYQLLNSASLNSHVRTTHCVAATLLHSCRWLRNPLTCSNFSFRFFSE